MNLKAFIKSNKTLYKLARGILHKTVRPRYEVLTLEGLFYLASDWADMLPKNFDCVVGVPRSGSLVANVVASKLNLPLSTPDEFIAGHVWGGAVGQQFKRLLIVEDAVNEGRALKEAIAKLKAHNPNLEILTGCLNTPFSSDMRRFINYSYINGHRSMIAEWHTHSFFANKKLAVDCDGVLLDEHGGGPLLVPSFRVSAVVSARLQSEYAETERQLLEHGVRYSKLILFPFPESKRTYKRVVRFKADVARCLGVDWFWESDAVLAKGICQRAGIPVYCSDNKMVYLPKKKKR